MRILVLILGLCLAGPAWAVDAMDKARLAYEDMEFDAALAALEAAFRGGGLEPAGLVQAYQLKGLSLSVLDRLDEALEAFRCMLSIDPEASIPPDTSPKLAAPFYQALVMTKDLKPIRLQHMPPPAEGRPGPLAAVLKSDPQGLVKSVRLVQRTPDGQWLPGDPQPAGPALTFNRPAGERVEYFFEALDEHRNVLARSGGPDRPFLLSAPATVAARKPEPSKPEPPPAVVGAASRDSLRDDQEDAPVAWHQSWWFWTAVGAVVVGTALGVGLGVGLSGDGSGPRDYTIEVR